MKTFVPLWLAAALVSICSASLGQILLKIGVRAALAPDLPRHPLTILLAFGNPFVIAGIFAFVLSMVFWLAAISGQQLSSVYPLAALGYVLVTIASVWLFQDTVTAAKIVGIALIVSGTVVLNAGGSAGAPSSRSANARSGAQNPATVIVSVTQSRSGDAATIVQP